MQRKILSVILAMNMAAGLAFTAYASEQEVKQTETAIESDSQAIQESSTGATVEVEEQIKTETEKKEDTNTSTVTEDKTGAIENETETTGNAVIEMESITETGASVETEPEIEITDSNETETGVATETEIPNETEPGTATETETGTGTTEETGTVTETGTGTTEETKTGTVTETETTEEIETGTATETGTTEEIETETETETTKETETETDMGTGTTEEIETGTVTETGTTEETETETETETEKIEETETETETRTEDETEMETETGTVEETETETEKITEEKLEENPVVYSVKFPAIDEFRFILDPYGLRALPEGKSASLEELKPYAGKIYCNNKMMVTNKSSVPVKVKVSIQLTGDICAVESVEDVEADMGNNVLLYVVPSENDLEGSLENYQKSNTGIVVKKDEPIVLEFMLPEGKYLYKESAEGESMSFGIADGETGHSAAFEIAGLVNTKADWKTFNEDGKKVGLKISYSYEDASDEDASDQPAAYSRSRGAFALLPYDGTTVDVAEAE